MPFRDTKYIQFKYPGIPIALNGNEAVVEVAKHIYEIGSTYPITPSTEMAEGFFVYVNDGHVNIAGRPNDAFQLEGEHAMAGGGIGSAMTGWRTICFTSAQGIAYAHEQLYVAAGKRLPLMVALACRAITKSTLNVHAGHDDYHCGDDAGFIQLLGASNQEAADLMIIGQKTAELAMTPIMVGMDGFLTSHLIQDMLLPERELILEYLGLPEDTIVCPTPAQKYLFGDTRRRLNILMDPDNPMTIGAVTNQDAYMQSVASERNFFYNHIADIADDCMEEYEKLTGRRYGRIGTYKTEDADYILVGMGSVVTEAQAVADYLREKRGIKVGVVNVTMFRPFPGDLLSHVLQGKKGVTVLERTDQPMAEDLPLVREVRAAVLKAFDNGRYPEGSRPYKKYARYEKMADVPPIYSTSFGLGSRDTQPGNIIAVLENMLPEGKRLPFFYTGVEFVRKDPFTPHEQIYNEWVEDNYPDVHDFAIAPSENPDLMPEGSVVGRWDSVGGWGAIATGKGQTHALYELLHGHIIANPKYGSEKKGQPTCFYFAWAPKPIRLMCELKHLEIVISPNPKVFKVTNPLAGLKRSGAFIIQSELTPEETWESFPDYAKKYIKDNDIQAYILDGFKIAREESPDESLKFRMQGIAFQGAFFQTSPVAERNGLTKEQILEAIHDQLKKKFGKKGDRIVEANFRVVKRGFTEVKKIEVK